jgi:DNA invertase Pin-like site-specific DNA recombinase
VAKGRKAVGIAPLSIEAEKWLRSCPDMGLAIAELIEIAASEKLTPPPALPSMRGNRKPRSSVKDEVLRLRKQGVKPITIARHLDVTRAWVYKILGESGYGHDRKNDPS